MVIRRLVHFVWYFHRRAFPELRIWPMHITHSFQENVYVCIVSISHIQKGDFRYCVKEIVIHSFVMYGKLNSHILREGQSRHKTQQSQQHATPIHEPNSELTVPEAKPCHGLDIWIYRFHASKDRHFLNQTREKPQNLTFLPYIS